MNITKEQREQVRQKFNGLCAYCGQPLPDRWHVDHFEPIERQIVYVSGKEMNIRIRSAYRAQKMIALLVPARFRQVTYW